MNCLKPLWDKILNFVKRHKYIVLSLFFLAVFIYLLIIFVSVPNIANGIIAFGTLMLALVTSLHILNSNDQEKRRRKERLLNEIIEWAFDVTACKVEPFSTKFDSISNEWSRSIMEAGDLAERFRDLANRGEYIKKIASGLGQDLDTAVEQVTTNIKERRLLLFGSMIIKPTPLDLDEGKKILEIMQASEENAKALNGLSEKAKNTIALGKNAGILRQAISKIIKEVSRIKIENIS